MFPSSVHNVVFFLFDFWRDASLSCISSMFSTLIHNVFPVFLFSYWTSREIHLYLPCLLLYLHQYAILLFSSLTSRDKPWSCISSVFSASICNVVTVFPVFLLWLPGRYIFIFILHIFRVFCINTQCCYCFPLRFLERYNFIFIFCIFNVFSRNFIDTWCCSCLCCSCFPLRLPRRYIFIFHIFYNNHIFHNNHVPSSLSSISSITTIFP